MPAVVSTSLHRDVTMQPIAPYTNAFYAGQAGGSLKSAEIIVPIVMSLLHPKSVVDVGCGVGTWLSVFLKQPGIDKVLGIEGEWVKTQQLHIPEDRLRFKDLTSPFIVEDTFDLAISLEVAEHLPPECASQFVLHLTLLAPVVLFSAAAPNQGGTNHINEQWPEYWAELFNSHGYGCCDLVRPHIWSFQGVQWWYAQNMLLFVKHGYSINQECVVPTSSTFTKPLSLVHPSNFTEKYNWLSDASNHGFF